jgi:hypothetical protein
MAYWNTQQLDTLRVRRMEDMMKTQMKTGLDTTMATTKKAIEG